MRAAAGDVVMPRGVTPAARGSVGVCRGPGGARPGFAVSYSGFSGRIYESAAEKLSRT